MVEKGKFIVIDGSDGSGKATQTELLVKRLKEEGYSVSMLDFPQYGERSATLVEDYLNGKFGTAEEVGPYRASIFFACDRFAAAKDIKERLDRGEICISNRYVSANMGHQAGKISDAAEKDKFLDWLRDLEYSVFGIPEPDCQIVLYVDPTIAQGLVDKKGHRDYVGGKKRDIHEDDIGHLENASDAFLYCANKFDWSVVKCSPDGKMRGIEDIHKDIYKIVKGEVDVPAGREIVFSTKDMSEEEKKKMIENLEKKYGVGAERK
jgi:dTMP kinase